MVEHRSDESVQKNLCQKNQYLLLVGQAGEKKQNTIFEFCRVKNKVFYLFVFPEPHVLSLQGDYTKTALALIKMFAG